MMNESEEEPVPWTESMDMDSEKVSELSEPPIINKFKSSAPDDQWLLTSSIKYQLKVEGRPLKNLNLDEPPGHIVTCTKKAEPEVPSQDEEKKEEAETVVDPGDRGSITTSLIPTEEWLLIPSLKYKLMMEAERKRSLEPEEEKCGKEELEAIMDKSKVDTAAEAEEEEWLLNPSIKYQLMLQARKSRKLKAAKIRCETGEEPGSSDNEEEMEAIGSEEKETHLEEEHAEETEPPPPLEPPGEAFEGFVDFDSIRWFGYILNTAHKRRPSFVPDPKEILKAMRTDPKKRRITTTLLRSSSETEYRKSVAASAAASLKSKNEKENDKDKEAEKEVKEVVKEGGKEKKKKDKKAKIKDKEVDDGPPKKAPEDTTVNMLTIETDLEPNIPKLADDYPTDLQDLKEVYEVMEKAWREAPGAALKVNAKDQTLRKAVVVRSALLAARMSFLNTCRSEADIYKGGEGEEAKAQSDYKQQLIEKNIDDMQFTAKVLGQCIDFTFN